MFWLIINHEKDSHKLLRNPKVTFISHAWSGILNNNSNEGNKHYWRREREDKKKNNNNNNNNNNSNNNNNNNKDNNHCSNIEKNSCQFFF